MTAKQYRRLEILLGQAEVLTLEHPPETATGKKIQAELSALLAQVAAEKFRAEQWEQADR